MQYKSIVCRVTGSEQGQKAAMEAALLAQRDNAKLTYVFAVDTTFLRKGFAVSLSHGTAEESLERIGEVILRSMDRIASSHGMTPKKVIRRGSVPEVVKSVILEEKADLLVVEHEKRTFFERVFSRGTVEDHAQELKQQTGVMIDVVTGYYQAA